jgi:hypothetical protein
MTPARNQHNYLYNIIIELGSVVMIGADRDHTLRQSSSITSKDPAVAADGLGSPIDSSCTPFSGALWFPLVWVSS